MQFAILQFAFWPLCVNELVEDCCPATENLRRAVTLVFVFQQWQRCQPIQNFFVRFFRDGGGFNLPFHFSESRKRGHVVKIRRLFARVGKLWRGNFGVNGFGGFRRLRDAGIAVGELIVVRTDDDFTRRIFFAQCF